MTGVYEAFSDITRQRIVHLLMEGPLCVCHFQWILPAPQVRISKHLAYLRKRGIVTSRRRGSRIYYSLPAAPSAFLAEQFRLLKEHAGFLPDFQRDLRRRTCMGKGESCGPQGRPPEGCPLFQALEAAPDLAIPLF